MISEHTTTSTDNLLNKLSAIDWKTVTESMNEHGYATIPKMLSSDQCNQLIQSYTSDLYRKTINMARYRFGKGEYKYFRYPLPAVIQSIREVMYPNLSSIANQWMEVLKLNTVYPETLDELLMYCHQFDQRKPTPLILKYKKGDFNTLHQDLYGEVFFPMQVVLFLNEPGRDYDGGEFVLTQQTPRAQSKAIVLKPHKGDMLIFATKFRPVKGTRGYYRAMMKHGVSEVTMGERHTVGVIFHDARQ